MALNVAKGMKDLLVAIAAQVTPAGPGLSELRFHESETGRTLFAPMSVPAALLLLENGGIEPYRAPFVLT